MVKAIVNIGSVGDIKTSGKQIHCLIWLLLAACVDRAQSFPTPNNSRQIGTIPLLSGKAWNHFSVIPNSQDEKSSSSKGDVTSEVTNTLSFILGGMRNEILDLLEGYQGEQFYIVLQDMESGKKYLYGSEHVPYTLQSFERVNGKDSRSCTLTFGNSSFCQPLEYVGALTEVAAVNLAADATALAVTAAQEYRTSGSNTADKTLATVSGLTAADEGRYITVVGGGGTHPTAIADGNVFVLRGGTGWTGTLGATITFQVFDTSTLIEVARS